MVTREKMARTVDRKEREGLQNRTTDGLEDEAFHIYEREFDPDREDSLGKLAKFIEQRSTVLELGPATGYFTRYMKEKLLCTVDCVELSSVMAERARPYCRHMLVANLDNIGLVENSKGRQYDFIIMADVIEHLRWPERVLEACFQLLKSNGKLLLSVPNIAHAAVVGKLLKGKFTYTKEGLLDNTHLRFFTRESLVDLLLKCGFKIQNLDTIDKLPEDTEIADDFSDLPTAVQDVLFKRSDALTFQFIIAVSKGTMKANEVKTLKQKEIPSIGNIRRSRNMDLRKKLEETQKALTEAQSVLSERNEDFAHIAEALEEAQGYVKEREKEVSTLQKELEKVRAGLSQAETLVSERDKEIAHIAEALEEAQRYAKEREKEVSRLQKELEKVRAGLSQAESVVSERDEKLVQTTDALQEAQRYVREREEQASKLETELKKVCAGLSQAESVVSERDEKLVQTTDALQEAQKCVKDRDEEVIKLEKALKSVREKLNIREQDLILIRGSRLWRYTSFLRRIERLLKN